MIIRRFFAACALLVLTSCSTVPITGRSQMNIIPGSSMLSMSLQQYDTFLKDHKLSTNKEQTGTVKRVGNRCMVIGTHTYTKPGNVVIDVGLLRQGKFPITKLESLAVGVEGKLFGGEIEASLLGGIIPLNARTAFNSS